VYKTSNNKEVCAGLFLDLLKASGRVNHINLLQKLDTYMALEELHSSGLLPT
jgi:hypothetical protein